jgi:hypothetical protein
MNSLMNPRVAFHLLFVGLALAAGTPPTAHAVTMSIINKDGSREGLNDPTPVAPVGGNSGTTLGEQRLNALQFAADTWGALLNSAVPVGIGAQFNPLTPCSSSSAVLGYAGSSANAANFDGAALRDTWYPIALANALNGQDLNPGSNKTEIEATFTTKLDDGSCAFPLTFYYGLDGRNPGNQVDFVTVALHELGHGLGFYTLVNLGSGAKAKNFDDVFMRNLENHSTGKRYPEMTNAERVAASQNSGNLVWVGPSVTAARGVLTSGTVGNHVRLYAPNPQEPGASVSHWDTALSPNQLMEPIITGTIHSVGLALQAFQDIGWPLEAGLEVTPSAFDYGSVDTGSASEETYSVQNPGSSSIHVTTTEITGANAVLFEVLGGVNSFTVGPGDAKPVTVRFTPAAPNGDKNATLRFTTNSSGGSAVDVPLRGTVVVANPKINVTPTSLDYRTVTVGTSVDQILTVKNTGTGTLTVASAQIAGTDAAEFEVQGAPSFSLAPGASHAVTVRFAPAAPSGARTAALEVNSNDPATPTKSVSLKGQSLVPVHDLAVTNIAVPVTVSGGGGTKAVEVQIQNRSNHEEVIAAGDLDNGLVTLTVTRIDNDGENCANAVVALDSSKNGKLFTKGPKTVNSKSTLAVSFLVTYRCSAPLPKSQSGEGDYSHSARVSHSVLGAPDQHTPDDTCPHDALGTDPNPDGKLKDNGCGTKQSNGTFIAPVTNVVP